MILLLLVLGFIWGQSCADVKTSSDESKFVTRRIIRPAIKAIAGSQVAKKITEPLIRKLAHVAEYTVLGFILGLMIRNRRPRFWLGLLLGLTVAVLDETVQMFTGRGSLITDIWIDMIGVTFGGLVALLFRPKNKGKTETSDTEAGAGVDTDSHA